VSGTSPVRILIIIALVAEAVCPELVRSDTVDLVPQEQQSHSETTEDRARRFIDERAAENPKHPLPATLEEAFRNLEAPDQEVRSAARICSIEELARTPRALCRRS
jgi:hypothetical protein